MPNEIKTHNEKMMELLKDKLNVVVGYAENRESAYNSKRYLSVNSPQKVLNLKSKQY